MFARRPRVELIARILLIVAILFGTPLKAFSLQAGNTGDVIAQEGTDTPTVEASVTPTAEPSVTPTENVPPATETPIVVTETPSPTPSSLSTEAATVTPSTETSTPSVSNDAPSLLLSVEPGFIPQSGIFMLKWEIAGIAADGLTLQIFLPAEVSLHGPYEGTYDETSRILVITLAALTGHVQMKSNTASRDITVAAELFRTNETVTKASLLIPAREQFVLEKQGGEITALNGKLKLKFPQDALSEKTIIEIGVPSGDAIPSYSLSGQPFELKAHNAQNGQEVKHFDQELSIEISYSELDIPQGSEKDLTLYWFNPETQDWAGLTSWVNTDTKTLHALTDHFTVFDINVNNWQSNHLPTLEPFQVSSFTGAATYSLPIEVPPGPGGLQPSLTLSYNSQTIDSSTVKIQASWVGMGWNLDAGYIELDVHGTPGSTLDDSYMLNLGSISSHIVQDPSGLFHTSDENFWKIQYNSGAQTWQIWDKSGNQYFFEQSFSYPYEEGNDRCPNIVNKTYLWTLTRQTNVFGQEIRYNYVGQKKTLRTPTGSLNSSGHCNSLDRQYDTAIYLDTITYAGGKYRIRFERGARGDYTASWNTDAEFHHYQAYNLQNIYVEQDSNSDGVFETVIRRYKFTYAANTDPDTLYPGYSWSAGGKMLTLRSVQQFGVGGTTSLPATTFTYDNLHLIEASNGYGGKVKFDYELYYYPIAPHYHVAYDRVGLRQTVIPGTSQVYWPRGSCWLDGPSRWVAKTTSDYVDCEPETGLVIAGTATGYPGFVGDDWLRPGGVYKIETSQWSGSVSASIFDGSVEHPFQKSIVILPKTASKLEVLLRTPNYQSAVLATAKLQFMTSIYRVKAKRLLDGKGNEYLYTYDYANPAVNDNAHSALVCPAPNPPDAVPDGTCNEYVEKYSEFRGHGQVTETAPDGTKTITSYYQDDVYKGRPYSVVTTDGAANLSRVDYQLGAVALPFTPPHPIWCTLCASYVGLYRYWVYTDYETTTIYGSTTVSKRTDYTYESTYGNLTDQSEYEGTSPTPYRTTHIDYVPNPTAYLVGLPARQQVKNSAGTVLAETQNIYGSNTSYNQAPPVGVLAAVRTWVDGALSSGRYSQTNYGYDGWGNRTAVTSYKDYGTSGPVTTTTAYDPLFHAYPISQTTPATQNVSRGLTTSWSYDYNSDGIDDYIFGAPTTETDPNGNSIFAQYDAFGRMTRLIRPEDNSSSPTLQITYNDTNTTSVPAFVTTITQKIDATKSYMVQREYDGMGRQTKIVTGSSSNASERSTVDTIYMPLQRDQSGNPVVQLVSTRQSQPYATGESVFYTETIVDSVAHTTKVKAPDGTITLSHTDGLVTTVTDANGHITTSTKDIWGRVTSVVPATGPSVSYVYDELDRLLTATRDGKVTAMKYDQAGRKIAMDDPDMGMAGTSSDDSWAWTYKYDALGNLTYQKDAKGCELILGYDALNRITSKNTGLGCTTQINNTYSYDQGANGIGFRTGMTDASGSTLWTYDARGRMKKESKTIDAETFNTWWSYNAADLVAQITYPDGEVVTNNYNDRMLLNELVGEDTYVQTSLYDSAGRMTKRVLGNDLTQFFNYYSWDETASVGGSSFGQGGRLKNVTVGKSPFAYLVNLNYVYDPVGNIATITDDVSNEKQTYRYDSLDRLRCWGLTTPNTVSGCESYTPQTDQFGSLSTSDIEYRYNPSSGNLAWKDGLELIYGDDAHAHAVTDAGNNRYSYDANGNQITRLVDGSNYTLNYDAENHLVGVTGPSLNASFTYDGDGRRVKSVINGVTNRFVNALYETEGDPQQINTNVTFQNNTPVLPNAAFTSDANWIKDKYAEFPASSVWASSTSHSGPFAYSVSNQTYGNLMSDAVTAVPGSQYTLSMWLRGQINPQDVAGGWIGRVEFYDASGQFISRHDIISGSSVSTTWTQVSGTVTAPANAATQKVWLYDYLTTGWVAFDDISLIKAGTSTNLIANPSFEAAGNWLAQKQPDFPGTSLWRSTWGITAPHSGSYAYVISNLAYGWISSSPVAVNQNKRYVVNFWSRGQLDPETSATGGGWAVTVDYYNEYGQYMKTDSIRTSNDASITPASWSWFGNNVITTPWHCASIVVTLHYYMGSGWVAFDDIDVWTYGTYDNILPNPSFETTGSWTAVKAPEFPATSVWRNTWGIAAPHSGSYAYAISNLSYGNVIPPRIPVTPGKSYDVAAWMRGKLDPATSLGGSLIRVNFHNSAGQFLSSIDIVSGVGAVSTSWQHPNKRVVAPANAATMEIRAFNYLATGWIAYDDFTAVEVGTSTNLVPEPSALPIVYNQQLSNSIPITPNTIYSLSSLVKGNGGTATGNWAVRLHYYDSAGNRLSTYTDIGSSTSTTTTTTGQAVGGGFTAPANAASMRISLSSALTGGTLKMDTVSLLQAPQATKYYFAGAQRVAMRVNDQLSYLVSDHLGSTSLVVKDTITGVRADDVISEMRYEPWGEVRYPSSGGLPLATQYTYTGQYSYMDDPTTSGTTEGFGLMFYNARMYDPMIGRFTSADTIVPGGVQGLDRYAYVNNNPLRYTDPSGHKCVGEKGGCDENGKPINGAGGWGVIRLSTRGQQLIDFAKSVGMTPEEVIGIGLGHEMFAWSKESDRDTHMQAYRNGYLRYVNKHCYGNSSRTCMLNYFAGSYESVYNQFLTKQSRYTEHTAFWGDRDAYLWAQYKDDYEDSNLSENKQDIVKSGMGFMGSFMGTISSYSYDPDMALNTGVVNAQALKKALGGAPTYEQGFLVIQSATCSNGAAGYSLIYNLWGEKLVEGLKDC